MILAGDVGGTKTHVALFDPKRARDWIVDAKYKSAEFSSLHQIILQFLKKHPGHQITHACFGIAGPIREQTCRATNFPWIIDAEVVKKETGIPHLTLINDLEANAYGIQILRDDEFFCLNPGKLSKGNKALIAAGTGLGEAGLYWDGTCFHPFASEGGHCSFAAENDLEMRLLLYLNKKFGHVSYERILSGPGLYNLYRFIIDEEIEKEKKDVKIAIQTLDPAKVITEMALKNHCPVCFQALKLFVSIFGSESANLVLKMLAVGGLYIGGGIAPKILPYLKKSDFMERFIEKGRFKQLLLGIPIQIILNENTALLGAVQALKHIV